MTFQRLQTRPTWYWVGVAGICAVGLGLAGCQSTPTETAHIAGESAAQGTSPIENYKQQIVREAMAGLRYDSGRVELDPLVGRDVGNVGDLDAAYAEFAAGEFDLTHENQFLKAIRHFSDAVMMVQDEPTFYVGLGQALDFKGRATQAEAAYRTALDLDPQSAEAHQLLAAHLYSYGRATEAISEWRAVLALEYNTAAAHGRLALAYYYQNDYAASARHLHEADRLGYDTPPQFRPLLAAALGQGG